MKFYEIFRKGTYFSNKEDATLNRNPHTTNIHTDFDKVVGVFITREEAEKNLPGTCTLDQTIGCMRFEYSIRETESEFKFQFEASEHGYKGCNILFAKTPYSRYFARVMLPDDTESTVSEDYGYLTMKKALMEQMTDFEKESAIFPYDLWEDKLEKDASSGEDVTVEIHRQYDDIFDLFEITR